MINLYFIYAFFRWCFTSGIKGFIVLGILIVALIAGCVISNNAVRNAMDPKPPVEDGITIPSKKTAPWVVVTSTRIYYAVQASKDKATGIYTITGYYEFIGGNWEFMDFELVLDSSFGEVNVSKRR